MKFINKDNTPIFDTFMNKYGQEVNYLYPELKDVEITVSTLTQEEKESPDENNEDSPFVCDVDKNTIKCSDEDCIRCGLNNDEKMALIAHEVGHFVIDRRGLTPPCPIDEYNEKEEKLADGFAVQVVDEDDLISALQKMADNISTKNDENEDWGYPTSKDEKEHFIQRIKNLIEL